MAGLFSTFNIATRGMAAQQKAVDVASHNIANANTEGYSRQRVNIETTRPYESLSMSIGTGSEVSSILRVRDSFMDYQIRNEISTEGQYGTRNEMLNQVESIFNEPSDTGITSIMGKFFDAFQELSKQPQSSNARTVVAEQSKALADALNHTYKQLSDMKKNTKSLVQSSVLDVNSTLTQLNDLNKQIISASITGNSPNDLMDKRDILIDNLSSKLSITVDKGEFNAVVIKPGDSLSINNNFLLRGSDSSNVRRLSYIDSIEKTSGVDTYKLVYYKFGDRTNPDNRQEITVTGIDSKEKYDALDKNKILVADINGFAINNLDESKGIVGGTTVSLDKLTLYSPTNGELKGSISIEKELDDYINEINKIAKALAFSVNAVHSGMTSATPGTVTPPLPDKDYMPFFVNAKAGTNLDNILAGEGDINAGNISVNKEILNDVMNIKTRTNDYQYVSAKENIIDGNKDGERALAIAKLRDSLIRVQDMGYTINSREDLFDPTKGGSTLSNNMSIENNINGTKVDSYYKDTIVKLGISSLESKRMVKNQDALLTSLKESRNSTSGVSIDEEVASIVQYQHAYQANAKVISVIDELLDVVVNGLMRR